GCRGHRATIRRGLRTCGRSRCRLRPGGGGPAAARITSGAGVARAAQNRLVAIDRAGNAAKTREEISLCACLGGWSVSRSGKKHQQQYSHHSGFQHTPPPSHSSFEATTRDRSFSSKLTSKAYSFSRVSETMEAPEVSTTSVLVRSSHEYAVMPVLSYC